MFPLLLFLASAPVAPPLAEPAPTEQPATPAPEARPLLSERTGSMALMLGLGSTLASYGVLAHYGQLGDPRYTPIISIGALGVFAGPSVGQLYAGSWIRPLIGTGGRGVAALMVLIGGLSGSPAGVVAILVGSAGFVGLTIADIVDGPFAVRRSLRRRPMPLAVAIVPQRLPDGTLTAMLTLSGRF